MQPGVEHLGFVSRSPEQTRLFGEELGRALLPGDLILLDGPFGAGKTTLVQGLATGAAASQRVTSPSFTLINEYKGRFPIFHVDLFRLGELDTEIEQAVEDCEGSEAVTVVEWPDLLPADLREGGLRIEMQVLGDSDRSLVAHVEGSRWTADAVSTILEAVLHESRDGER